MPIKFSSFGDFCAHSDDDNRTDYFTPYTCGQDKKAVCLASDE